MNEPPWDYNIKRVLLRDGRYVERYEHPNCGWLSGWRTPMDALQMANDHQKSGCDCRLRPDSYDNTRKVQCQGILNTYVYAGGTVARSPGERCSRNATTGPWCKTHVPGGAESVQGNVDE